MVNVFPAESTRSASIWSSRVSTPSTGITTVRMVGIVTVMYIAVAKTNAAVKVRVFVFPEKKRKKKVPFNACAGNVCTPLPSG